MLDTQHDFTYLGQWIIILLVQLGGLGILTFGSFFAYLFSTNNYSFRAQLILKELTKSDLGSVFNTIRQIILVTLWIELIGALVIYYLVNQHSFFTSAYDTWHFAIFHSISAFCNAGFSTLSDSLSQSGFQNHYALHWTITLLFVFGGLGFPITQNFIKVFRYFFIRNWQKYMLDKRPIAEPNLFNVNSRIVLISTGILLFGGTMLIWWLEKDRLLADYSLGGQITHAFFTAATPRTAGFNTVHIYGLSSASLLILLMLMWIGASPRSTGGGIKTTAIAIAVLNMFSVARNKKHVEVFRKRIHEASIHQAFTIILLSLGILFLVTLGLSITEPEQPLFVLLFESVSATSTVGLSLDLTPHLSYPGKIIVVLAMFVGRVGMFSVFAGFLSKNKIPGYEYPSEKIFLN